MPIWDGPWCTSDQQELGQHSIHVHSTLGYAFQLSAYDNCRKRSTLDEIQLCTCQHHYHTQIQPWSAFSLSLQTSVTLYIYVCLQCICVQTVVWLTQLCFFIHWTLTWLHYLATRQVNLNIFLVPRSFSIWTVLAMYMGIQTRDSSSSLSKSKMPSDQLLLKDVKWYLEQGEQNPWYARLHGSKCHSTQWDLLTNKHAWACKSTWSDGAFLFSFPAVSQPAVIPAKTLLHSQAASTPPI